MDTFGKQNIQFPSSVGLTYNSKPAVFSQGANDPASHRSIPQQPTNSVPLNSSHDSQWNSPSAACYPSGENSHPGSLNAAYPPLSQVPSLFHAEQQKDVRTFASNGSSPEFPIVQNSQALPPHPNSGWSQPGANQASFQSPLTGAMGQPPPVNMGSYPRMPNSGFPSVAHQTEKNAYGSSRTATPAAVISPPNVPPQNTSLPRDYSHAHPSYPPSVLKSQQAVMDSTQPVVTSQYMTNREIPAHQYNAPGPIMNGPCPPVSAYAASSTANMGSTTTGMTTYPNHIPPPDPLHAPPAHAPLPPVLPEPSRPYPPASTATSRSYGSPAVGGTYAPPHVPPQPLPSSKYPGGTQAGVFRAPGSTCTLAEWNQIRTPIGLLQEYQLLPSDTADLPPKPSVVNQVNCNPDVMRCTLTNMPATSKLLSRCRLPLGLVMHPFKDLSNLHTIHSKVIVRCRSCRAYINPFVQFVDSGRRWRCPVCFLANTVPDDFFFDPGTHSYGDPTRRPEIRSATVEFVAPSEYMLRPPQPATYLFCFDVSHNALATGYLPVVCERLAATLNRIPGDSRAQIGFLSFDSAVHFYKFSDSATRMMVCPDIEEPFIPDTEGLICRLEESGDAIRDFLLHLPESFAADAADTKNCLGSALQVALKLIGATGGRITVFNTCLPNVGAGSLTTREEQSDRISTDVKCLGPAIDFYKTFALDCSAQQVAVDLFIMNSQYCDIATLSGVARFSSGFVYHYPDFYSPTPSGSKASSDPNPSGSNPPIELERFKRDFDRYLTRKIGFEAVMRIRCTQGLTIQSFHGSFFVRSTDLLALPNVNPDAGFAIQLGISETLEKYSSVCCQAAILYTSARGGRRIRVHTLCLPVVHNPSEVFQGADQGAIACLIGKMAVDRVISSGLACAREAMANAVADALSAYASAIGLTPAASIGSYSMACPVNLRLLALYICGMLRYTAFRVGAPVRADDRSAALELIKCSPANDVITLCYPALYSVHQLVSKPITSQNVTLAEKAAALRLSDYGDAQLEHEPRSDDGDSSSSEASDLICEASQLPGQLHLSLKSITSDGVYLLDMGDMFFLLVGNGPSETLNQLLGINAPSDLPSSGGPFILPFLLAQGPTSEKPDTDIPIARRRLLALLNLLRFRRPIGTALMCMRHDAPPSVRARFLSAFVEDRTEYAPSYQEFLQMIQNLVKS